MGKLLPQEVKINLADVEMAALNDSGTWFSDGDVLADNVMEQNHQFCIIGIVSLFLECRHGTVR